MTIKNIRLLNYLALSAFSIISTQVMAAVPNSFSAGNPVVATDMNANFDNLDNRISTLESSSSTTPSTSIAVNCTTDTNALINTQLQNDFEYVLTGMCSGPIRVTGNKSVKFIGDANGIKDDGIILPTGLTESPSHAVAAYGPNQLILENLTISSINYVTNNYSFGTTVGAVGAIHNARTILTNVAVIGGDYAVRASKGGVITILEGVTATSFNISGLLAADNSHIDVRKPITVTGSDTSTDSYPEAIGVYRNSSVQIQEGGTFTTPTGANTIEKNAITTADNSTVRIRNLGTTVLNGGIGAYRSSVVRLDAGTLNSDIGSGIYAGDGSALRLTNVDINASYMQFYRNSSGDFRGTTDLGNVDITSCSPGSVSVRSTVTNKGLVCGQ